ncbi:MAG: hypothetical protein KGY66_05165 [Candidatus Thermoplasmatota archaeon]|nr:hypothetical protein [Candidatus Thermoplasmatota archaeon]MBS3790288.1 hypothetical protein [Candidatus Thermoplasmatota archaeon]
MIEDIDYLVSAVMYGPSDIKVKKVLTHEKKDQYGVGYPFEETRNQLLKKIEDGKCYYTLVKQEDTSFEYNVGEEIKKIDIDSEAYLRTDDRKEKKDYLGGLQRLQDLPY